MKKNKPSLSMIVAGVFGMLFAAAALGERDYLNFTVISILSIALMFSFRK